MHRKRWLTLIALVALLASIVTAGRFVTAHGDETHGDSASASPEASSMAGIDTGTGAVYLTITNNGGDGDTLVAASSAVAKVVEVHDMVVENEVMSMVHLEEGLEIPAGETVVLEPMSLHVMLIGLNQSLMPGESFELTLTFEHAGDVTVPVTIATEAPEAGEPVNVGDLVIEGVWSRPAPMLTSQSPEGTPDATPAH